MSKILCTGDWHLDRSTAGYDRFYDILEAVDQTVDAAINESIDLYVFLGDLSNPNTVRSHRAVAAALETANKLKDIDIDSLWITGNHDVIEDGTVDGVGNYHSTLSPLKASGFLVASISCLVHYFGFAVISLPYPASHCMYDPVEKISEFAKSISDSMPVLVIGHLSMNGAAMGSESVEIARGRSIEWPREAINKYLPNAICIGGHYHKRQTYNGVSFVGSLARLGFDEEGNKPSYLILEV